MKEWNKEMEKDAKCDADPEETKSQLPTSWLKTGHSWEKWIKAWPKHSVLSGSFAAVTNPKSTLICHKLKGVFKTTNIVWLPFTRPQIRQLPKIKTHCNSTQNPFNIESGCWAIWAFLCTYLQAYKIFNPCIQIYGIVKLTNFDHVFHLSVWPNKLTIFKHMVSPAFPHLVGPDSSPKCFEVTSVASAKAHKLNK